MNASNSATHASFTKLQDGTWGIRITGQLATTLTKGQSGFKVEVSKKDGSKEMKEVTGVLWIGKDDRTGGKAALCKVASDRPSGGGRGNSGFRSNGPRPPRGQMECEECGDWVTPGSRCWETGMTH